VRRRCSCSGIARRSPPPPPPPRPWRAPRETTVRSIAAPAIALAASLAGAFALWRAEEPAAQIVAQVGAADVVAEMVQGAPIEDAARTFARSVTSEVNLAELAPQ
jgi:hypothetical protein